VRGEFLDLAGARLYYYAAGTRGAGVPAVFIHGFATSSHLWNDAIPLVPSGHRVVVLDLLGHGRSDRPGLHAVDAAAHAERVVAMLDELQIERACVVGHGMGGGVAQILASRFSPRVSHLCLINSVAFEYWPTFASFRGKALAPLAAILPPSVLTRVLRADLARGYGDRERATHSIDLYLRPFDCPEGRDAVAAHVKGLSGMKATARALELYAIAAPTAIIAGQHDRAIPTSLGRRLQQSIHASTLDVIPGARHFTPEESPRPIAEVIQRLLNR